MAKPKKPAPQSGLEKVESTPAVFEPLPEASNSEKVSEPIGDYAADLAKHPKFDKFKTQGEK